MIAAEQRIKRKLFSHLQNARFRTDELFQLVRPDARYERPIPERHRIVFYLGHMEAFDWNLICAGAFGMESLNKEFDRLFAFGIDPTDGGLPQDTSADWPRESEIRQYNGRVREMVDRCLNEASEEQIFWTAIEHRLMHAETLAYMLHWLPFSMKHAQPSSIDDFTPVAARQVEIPAAEATLGMTRGRASFGWDNEFDEHRVEVPAFSIDVYKVTNAQYLEFVRAGGYLQRTFWMPSAWEWINAEGIRHPKFWRRSEVGWTYRTMFADIPLPLSWPAYVSYAEAEAYVRWKHKALPTEAQFHRAAFGAPDGSERRYPWGNHYPQRHFGNFGFGRWDPCRVDAHPEGNSAFGVADLVGNGWEWTSTRFAPFPGFEPLPFYPGYSANFFDDAHYVLKGASSRTASLLVRRSFRNWFQPLYPNIYAGFRCVEN